MTEATGEIAVLFWIVAAGLILTVVAIVVLIRRGYAVPLFTGPSAKRSKKQNRARPPRAPLPRANLAAAERKA